MANQIVLCDTGIFLDYFRGDVNMLEELEEIGFEYLAISSVTIAEAYFGMHKREERKSKEAVKKFNKYHITKDISQHFLGLMLSYRNYRLAISDALIASTTITNNLLLFTHNIKGFGFIEDINFYEPKRKFGE